MLSISTPYLSFQGGYLLNRAALAAFVQATSSGRCYPHAVTSMEGSFSLTSPLPPSPPCTLLSSPPPPSQPHIPTPTLVNSPLSPPPFLNFLPLPLPIFSYSPLRLLSHPLLPITIILITIIYPDVMVANCLQSIGVTAYDSRDSMGRIRFHCVTPSARYTRPVSTIEGFSWGMDR